MDVLVCPKFSCMLEYVVVGRCVQSLLCCLGFEEFADPVVHVRICCGVCAFVLFSCSYLWPCAQAADRGIRCREDHVGGYFTLHDLAGPRVGYDMVSNPGMQFDFA